MNEIMVPNELNNISLSANISYSSNSCENYIICSETSSVDCVLIICLALIIPSIFLSRRINFHFWFQRVISHCPFMNLWQIFFTTGLKTILTHRYSTMQSVSHKKVRMMLHTVHTQTARGVQIVRILHWFRLTINHEFIAKVLKFVFY